MKDGNLCLIWGRVAWNGWIYKVFQTIGNKCSQHSIWQSLRADIFPKFVPITSYDSVKSTRENPTKHYRAKYLKIQESDKQLGILETMICYLCFWPVFNCYL